MRKKAIIFLANGFEEIEAVTVIDILRRAGINLTIAGVGNKEVISSRQLVIRADVLDEECDPHFDALILPGGMPGAEHLASSSKVKSMINSMNTEGKIIAAICASPAIVLAPMKILNGKKATCFPGMEEGFTSETKFVEEKVVQDGNIITSRGAGTASDFAFKLVENLISKDMADSLCEQMLFCKGS